MSDYNVKPVVPDELAVMDEGDLRGMLQFLRRAIRRSNDDMTVKAIEENFCYVQHELETRERRRIAHEKYLMTHPFTHEAYDA